VTAVPTYIICPMKTRINVLYNITYNMLWSIIYNTFLLRKSNIEQWNYILMIYNKNNNNDRGRWLYYTAAVEKQLRVSNKTKHNWKYYIFGPIKQKNTIIRHLLHRRAPLRTVCGNSLPLGRSPNIVAGTCSTRTFLDRYILCPVCWSDALGKTCKRRDTAISEFSSY